MKTIYLHAGRGKTGSTAIQAFLANQSEQLRSADIHYIQADGGRAGNGHQQFAKSFIPALPDYMDSPINPHQVRQQVAAEISESTSSCIVLSSENFPLADERAVVAFFEALPIAVELKIIYFARSQDELVESEYNQMVKLKRETRSVQTYFEQAFSGADFFAEAQKWEAVVGRENVICRIYDGSDGGVLAQFLACLPGQPRTISAQHADVAPSAKNRSLGIRALTTTRLLNMVALDDRRSVYTTLFDEFSRLDEPAILFDSNSARAIRNAFAESNGNFLQRYFDIDGTDIGGRRYTDDERDERYRRIRALQLGG